jgi:dethiobiotin synthetase
MGNTLFIAGTDTDAGKTVLTCALAAYWLANFSRQALGILKPLQTGVGDRELYHRLFGLTPSLEALNPLHFDAPLAPPLAADLVGRRISLDIPWQAFEALRRQKDFVLVEGLGGLGSPVTHETTVADLAWDWQLPMVLVVPVKLGAIGQAVANVALARQSKIHLKGIVLSCGQPCTAEQIEQWAPATMITGLTGMPVLGTLPYLSDPHNLQLLAAAAAGLDLEQLMPLPFEAIVR